MAETTTIHIHLHNDLREGFKKYIKDKQYKASAYINQLIREDLRKAGYL